ncbi:MAG: PQQ-dependent sugar dehydrogenase, partial [Syntrophothermus sp.]
MKYFISILFLFLFLFLFLSVANAQQLILPAGFKATVVVEELGRNRHIVVSPGGDIYVKLSTLLNGKGIIILRKNATSGKYQVYKSFGDYTGTGIAISGNYLYASSDNAVYRYDLKNNEVVNPEKPEVLISGFSENNQHGSKSITLDDAGNLYVNIGAPSNSCQKRDRSEGSMGMDPCPQLETSAGIWQFRADKTGQTFKNGIRYGAGIRNTVGLDWNRTIDQLFVMQHGRDQLYQNFPKLYTLQQGAELPAEEMFMVTRGADFGWPYCYYDQIQQKRVLAPEYGGDGKKEGRCGKYGKPVIAFPGHWAPNAMVFYTGSSFPEKYRNGAFIA